MTGFHGRRPVRRYFGAAMVAAAVAAAAASPAVAQVVRGTVVEEGTRAPVDGAMVTLFGERGDSVAVAVTQAGAFSITGPRSGVYRLRVVHLGYAPARTDTLTLERGMEVTVEILVGRAAIPLEPLRVLGRRIPLLPRG
jgi:hypothetical protein